jgi:hypothetical protein
MAWVLDQIPQPHIAQFLRHDWYQRHLANLDGINPTHLRRTAALHLCQMAVGGSIRQAAVRLGLPDTTATAERCHSNARAVHRWAKQRQDPYEFETAVHNLADELEASPHRIDYHQRRAALDGLCIDADTWAHLVAQLSDSPWPHRRELELGDRKRHCVSVIVWARITGGEHLFAPHPLRDQQPAQLRDAWRLSAYALFARFRDGCTVLGSAGSRPSGDVMNPVGHGVGLAARPGAADDDRHGRSVGVWRCPGLFGGAHEGSAFRWIRLVVWLGGVNESRRSRLRAAS